MDIVVCDDHRLMAELLTAVLTDRGHQAVTVTSPAAACAEAATRKVDVCVMDLGFPDAACAELDPVEAIRRLVASGTRVVVLSGSEAASSRTGAVEAGAAAFMLKGEPVAEVVRAVEEPGRRSTLPLRSAPAPQREWTHASLADFLTPRERSVLEGLVHGEPTAVLAARLGVRPATARTHVQNLLAKLCVHSRLEAVALAVEHGLVEIPDESA